MPYAPHFRLTMSGTLGQLEAPYDRWAMRLSFTPRAEVFNLLDPRVNLGFVNDMATDCKNWFTRPTTGIRGRCNLTEVKVAPIGPDGKYGGNPIVTPVVGAAGQHGSPAAHPGQISQVVSLMTATRGASGRGRAFVPGTGCGVDPITNRTSAADALAAATSFARLIADLQNVGDSPLTVQVVVPSLKGFNSPVTGVRVGDELDTVRSRRNQDSEKYSFAVIP